MDRDRLQTYLDTFLPPQHHPRLLKSVKQFSFGQSNPTFLLEFDGEGFGGKRMVLRKAPEFKDKSKIPQGAHNVSREFHLQRLLLTLPSRPVPVPEMIHLATDGSGTAGLGWNSDFYLMDFVPGTVYQDPSLRNVVSRDMRFSIYRNAIVTLARLHSIPRSAVASVFKGATGKSTDVLERTMVNMERVIRRQEAASLDIPRIHGLSYVLTQLRAILPNSDNNDSSLSSTCIIHGDYKLDNLVNTDNTYSFIHSFEGITFD